MANTASDGWRCNNGNISVLIHDSVHNIYGQNFLDLTRCRGVQLAGLRIGSLLLAGDVLPLASSGYDLQLLTERFAVWSDRDENQQLWAKSWRFTGWSMFLPHLWSRALGSDKKKKKKQKQAAETNFIHRFFWDFLHSPPEAQALHRAQTQSKPQCSSQAFELYWHICKNRSFLIPVTVNAYQLLQMYGVSWLQLPPFVYKEKKNCIWTRFTVMRAPLTQVGESCSRALIQWERKKKPLYCFSGIWPESKTLGGGGWRRGGSLAITVSIKSNETRHINIIWRNKSAKGRLSIWDD